MTYAQALGKQWPADEAKPKWDFDEWQLEKVNKLVDKLEHSGFGFMLRENHEITAMALERISPALMQSLVNLWADDPENETLDGLADEANSHEPQKF